MSRKRKMNLDTGIEIWDGQPGSGKSYGAVEFLTRVILQQRRPVFTNLPLRFRVLRAFLAIKGRDIKLAKYIQAVSRDHFYRFTERNELYSEFREVMKGEGWSESKIEAEFQANEGEHVYEGSSANWFYPGSVFIFDEFHRWADQRFQKNENPAFLTYATMHRHHIHWIILLTQDKMQVSIPWRRNCSKYVRCADKRRLPFMFGLKLPIPAFAYEEYPAEMCDKGDTSQVKPVNTEVRIPWVNGGVIWRLYDSFTHMGGFRRLHNKLEAVRLQIEGEDAQADTPEAEDQDMAKKKRKWSVYVWPVVALVAVGALVVQAVPGCQEQPVAKPDPYQSPTVSELNAKREAVRQHVTAAPPEPVFRPVVTVAAEGYVIADGRTVRLRGSHQGYKLVGIEVSDGQTMWQNVESGDAEPDLVVVDFGLPAGAGGGKGGIAELRRKLRDTGRKPGASDAAAGDPQP